MAKMTDELLGRAMTLREAAQRELPAEREDWSLAAWDLQNLGWTQRQIVEWLAKRGVVKSRWAVRRAVLRVGKKELDQ